MNEDISKLSNEQLDFALVKYTDPDIAKEIQRKPTDALYHNEILPRPTRSWNDLIPLMIENNVQYHLNAISTQRFMAELLLKSLEAKQ